MSADPFQAAAHIAERSQVARAGELVLAWVRRAGAQSVTFDRWRRVRTRLHAIVPSDRVRSAGIVLLVATITQAVLLQWTPPMLRPAAPSLLRLEIAVVAVLLIARAKPIADGWAGSRIRQLLSRAGPSPTIADEPVDRT